ncbi:MAG: hypothetical protein V3U29_07480 [Phycisphaeraceae bacterium]
MDRILGQERAINVLHKSLQSGRLHHAWVFHGPVGVGKFTTAVAYARTLLCHDAQADLTGRITACGSCASCRLLPDAGDVTRATHPDLHVVTKELARYDDDRQIRERKLMQIPVEVLRSALLAPAYLAAGLRHNKVFIVDEAELLNPTGQNLLLKTLEEPPAGTFLILVTSNEDRLLPTIRSRCQRVAFGLLGQQVVADWLDRQPTPLNETERQWMVRFADGSIGRAKLALEYHLSAWAETVLPAIDTMAEGDFPTPLGKQITEMIDGFAKQWVDRHENASKEAANRQAAALMWSLIGGEARRRIAELAQGCDPTVPDAAEAALGPWLGVIDALSEAERHLASNVNLSLTCDHLVSLIHRRLSDRDALTLPSY